MNLQAAVIGIAPAGGIRPASHITASSVSATKAEPAAHYLAAVIEGRLDTSGRSDLSRSSNLPANASACMRNMDLNQQVSPIGRYGNAESILSGQRSNRGAPYGVSRGQEVARLMARVSPVNMTPHCYRHHGNLCAEKVRPHRPRQNKSAVRREYPDDVGACQQWHSAGVDRQGTLTIIGSNVRLGTEMPVALSLF